MLQVRNIKKKFDGKEVLTNITFEADKGDIISLLGPSGSGKSTLLNILLGLVKQDEGKIVFDGEDISDIDMREREFNIVFQDYALFPHLTAYENIIYGLKNKRGLFNQETVDSYIELLDLHPHLNKNIHMLSGGQKQRVAIARTLVMKPKLLLLDEPLSALDGVMKESIKQHIKKVAKQLNLTTIIVTHDPEEALTLSDKVLIINEGIVEQYSTPKNIIEKPGNQFINLFIREQLKMKYRNIHQLFGDVYAQ